MKQSDDIVSGAAALSDAKRDLLLKYLEGLPQNPSGPAPLKRRATGGPTTLSFAQQQIWVHSQLAPDFPVYNETLIVSHRGALQVGALDAALTEIVRRHEAWRTTFDVVNGQPVQVVQPAFKISLTVTDLEALPPEQREPEAFRLGTEQARRIFDLENGPLFRVMLVRLDDLNYRLFFTFHHIIFDGVSAYHVFLPELIALYGSFSDGRPSPLPELPVQYSDFAVWQREYLRGPLLDEQLQYWKKQLSGLVRLELPTDRPRPAVQTFRGAMHPLAFSKEVSDELKALSKREGATLFDTLLAAFQVLLYRYTGQEDLAVGTVSSGRKRSECEGLLGCFQNPLVLRADLSGDPPFRQVIRRAREVKFGALAHDDVPFELLVQGLRAPRDLSRNPLFQVLFSLVPAIPDHDVRWNLNQLDVDAGASKFDLYLELDDRAAGMIGRLVYSTDLFDAATIARMAGQLGVLLEGIAANPDELISGLPILSEMEKRQALVEWNNTARDYPLQAIPQVFEAQAAQRPENVALVHGSRQMSYRQLNEKANQVAHYLLSRGVLRGHRVGVCMERSPEMIVALLGILKAGAAYAALDASYPAERLAFMIQDAGIAVVLTQQRVQDRVPLPQGRVSLDAGWPEIAAMSAENLPLTVGPDDLAYVAYTSGSTGRPKGVEVLHRGVLRLLFGVDYAHFGPDETLMQLAPLSFDASTLEVWGALLHGGRCVIFFDNVPGANELAAEIDRQKVTTMWLTASLFNLVADQAPRALGGLRQLLIGGEALSVSHVNRAYAALPDTRMINGYGPTEGTTFTCCYRIPRPPADAPLEWIPIGRPIANTRVYLLDRHLNLVPIGVDGELHIGGDGLARGYLNQPELTAEKFIPDPFGNDSQARLYKTGDLARYHADGAIEFRGRLDDQVKIRGHRIELGEIEAVLAQHPGIREATATVREDAPGDKRLVAYFVAQDGVGPSPSALKTFLKSKVPEYMIPGSLVLLPAIPLTANGKVDRRRLPAPGPSASAAAGDFTSPRDEFESRLVRIWEEVLATRPISVHQDFFDLGGHSLLAVKLMHRVEQEFGKRLPLATLLQAPTVEQMAGLVRHEGWAPSWSSLVAIQPRGSRPPFFLIHGIGGNLLRFNHLARYLGADQPVYGLQAQGLDGKRAPLTRIEDMATLYVQEMRSLQPEGPYHVGGLSFGGIVAFEMAQQLHAQGQQVGLLALFDTFPGRVVSRATLFIKFLRLSFPGKIRYFGRKALLFVEHWKNRITNLSLPRALKDVQQGCRVAARRYIPKVYPGRVTLFRANQRSLRGFDDAQAGWAQWAAGGLEIHEVPGDHLSIITEPNVRMLADRLQACLDAAQGNGREYGSATARMAGPSAPENNREVPGAELPQLSKKQESGG